MKYILQITILCLSIQSFAQTIEEKISALEIRIQQLESGQKSKIEYCELQYRDLGATSVNCKKGAFVSAAMPIGAGNVIQINCGYYQLQCYIKNPNGTLSPSIVNLKN